MLGFPLGPMIYLVSNSWQLLMLGVSIYRLSFKLKKWLVIATTSVPLLHQYIL